MTDFPETGDDSLDALSFLTVASVMLGAALIGSFLANELLRERRERER